MSVAGPEQPVTRQRSRLERWSPPIIIAAAVFALIQLDKSIPFDPGVPPAFGLAALAVGIALAAWSWWTLRRAGTTNDGTGAATALVTHGPFRLSRNPHRLGLFLGIVGLGLLIGKGWLLLMVVVPVLSARLVHIPREEAHLAALFGDEWTAYAARTRRWL